MPWTVEEVGLTSRKRGSDLINTNQSMITQLNAFARLTKGVGVLSFLGKPKKMVNQIGKEKEEGSVRRWGKKGRVKDE